MKDKILTILFVSILGFFFIINIIMSDKELSYSERRKMMMFPQLNINNILSGKWMDDFDEYVLDQFSFREEFRHIKALSQIYLFRKENNNGLFIKDNYIYKIEYPLNEKSVYSFVHKMNELYDKYLSNMHVYYSIIPDKNYYLSNHYLKMDYNKLFSIVNNNMNYHMKYIDITNLLSISDYYRTDTHWMQNRIDKVVKALSQNMDFDINNNYTENCYSPFYGVFYGQSALKIEPDKLCYLSNEIIARATIYDSDSALKVMYEVDSLGKMDSYDVFLSGTTPYLTITNPLNENGKELIIFRDSFASTIAPLLINGYSKITLVDLRYISPEQLKEKIEFNNQDILILYNTIMINNSEAISV